MSPLPVIRFYPDQIFQAAYPYHVKFQLLYRCFADFKLYGVGLADGVVVGKTGQQAALGRFIPGRQPQLYSFSFELWGVTLLFAHNVYFS